VTAPFEKEQPLMRRLEQDRYALSCTPVVTGGGGRFGGWNGVYDVSSFPRAPKLSPHGNPHPRRHHRQERCLVAAQERKHAVWPAAVGCSACGLIVRTCLTFNRTLHRALDGCATASGAVILGSNTHSTGSKEDGAPKGDIRLNQTVQGVPQQLPGLASRHVPLQEGRIHVPVGTAAHRSAGDEPRQDGALTSVRRRPKGRPAVGGGLYKILWVAAYAQEPPRYIQVTVVTGHPEGRGTVLVLAHQVSFSAHVIQPLRHVQVALHARYVQR